MSTEDKLKQQIKDNDILIYMKGTPYEPRCGFSARTVQALIECEAQFSYVDVLENDDIRSTLPQVSDWPTFPQVFVEGDLIGGADIVTQMHENGELKNLGYYNNGKIEGKYYFFDRKGNIKEKRLYKDGNLIRVIKIN